MATRDPTPMSTDLHHPLFSRFYARVSRWMEAQGMAGLRTELLVGLTGRVIEIGAGNGMNFAHYPPTVTEVLAVEPEPYLRRLAARPPRPRRSRSPSSPAAPNSFHFRTTAPTLPCCAW
jgi:hypothetical protein